MTKLKAKNNIIKIDENELKEFLEKVKCDFNLSNEDDTAEFGKNNLEFSVDNREDFDYLMNTHDFETIFNGDFDISYRQIDDRADIYLEKILSIKGINIIERYDADYFSNGTIQDFKEWILKTIEESEQFIIDKKLTNLI